MIASRLTLTSGARACAPVSFLLVDIPEGGGARSMPAAIGSVSRAAPSRPCLTCPVPRRLAAGLPQNKARAGAPSTAGLYAQVAWKVHRRSGARTARQPPRQGVEHRFSSCCTGASRSTTSRNRLPTRAGPALQARVDGVAAAADVPQGSRTTRPRSRRCSPRSRTTTVSRCRSSASRGSLGHELAGIVFTAHPTFSLSARRRRLACS